MSHTVGLAHCLHYLDIGICQQGPLKEAFRHSSVEMPKMQRSPKFHIGDEFISQPLLHIVTLFFSYPSHPWTERPSAMSCPKGAANGPIFSMAASTDSRTDGCSNFGMLLGLFLSSLRRCLVQNEPFSFHLRRFFHLADSADSIQLKEISCKPLPDSLTHT